MPQSLHWLRVVAFSPLPRGVPLDPARNFFFRDASAASNANLMWGNCPLVEVIASTPARPCSKSGLRR